MSVQQSQFKPFISDDKQMAEMTPFSVILGIILAIVFGAANAYLGLCVGMTVSASIPAAVVSMGLVRFIFHRDFILENNMVQTIGSASESVAAGGIISLIKSFPMMIRAFSLKSRGFHMLFCSRNSNIFL